MKSVLLKLVFFGGDGDLLSGSGTFLLDRRTNDDEEEDRGSFYLSCLSLGGV